MAQGLGFGKTSTADEVLAGLDLTGKTVLVTGVNAGLGQETIRALGARGAQVIGLARSQEAAAAACAQAGGDATPVACDLADARSIAGAVETVTALGRPIDAVIANAGIMALPKLTVRDGLEMQFLVNHIGHFQLVTGLLPSLKSDGRVVMVSSNAVRAAPREGVMFDNLDGSRGYSSITFYGQSKLANALFAKELSRRGHIANALHPGVIASTNLGRHLTGVAQLIWPLAKRLTKSIPQGAATQTLLAAHPALGDVSGQFWADCRPVAPPKQFDDTALGSRLWELSEAIVQRRLAA
jgi:WW domain-containing oxidoreductase